MFKVECEFTYGWDDAGWTLDGEPWRFATREEAEAEIDELIAMSIDATKRGHILEAYSRKSYRVVEDNPEN